MFKKILWKMCVITLCSLLTQADAAAKNYSIDSAGLMKSLTDSSASLTSQNLIIDLRPEAEEFTINYLERNKELLEKMKQKSTSYFSTFDKVFEEYNIPVELKYLAVIESQLSTNAVSNVGAVGLWQFMPSTARLMGLKVSGKTDERKYKYKSTRAAARYLKDLYEIFNDWLLVIAAYNCGPARVQKAIKESGSNDFWKLQYHLPRQSRMHVKKFISTHFYFEGSGSMVTMTKAETEKYLKALLDAAETVPGKTNEKKPEQPVYQNWVAIVHNDQSLKIILRK